MKTTMIIFRKALCSIAAIAALFVASAAYAAVDTVTTTADSGPGSLRNTIAAAGSGDTVVFSASLVGQSIQLTSGELFIGQNLTIDASALAGGMIIDGGGSSRVIEIGGVNVIMKALTVTNGYVNADSGAGVLLDTATASLIANNCVFCGNLGAEQGGGILTYGTLTLNNCTVSSNSAAVYGGGIYNDGGAVALNNCTLSGNSVSDGGGGGIESDFGTLTLNGCTVSGNVAAYFGGGVDDDDDNNLVLTNCVFVGNFSETGGGLSADTAATLASCIFSNNISTNGGGIINYATLTLNNCTLTGNDATNGAGGGIVNGDILTANNCGFINNTATNGGAIYNAFNMTLNSCTLSTNWATAENGGGIYNDWTLTVSNCVLDGNRAYNGQGGGIYNWHTLVLNDCLLYFNYAINGGGIADSYGGGDFSGSILTANGCTFFENNATYGGGIFNVVSMTLNNCTMLANSANAGYGGALCSQSVDTSYGYDATNYLVNCTIYENEAISGFGGGIYGDSSSTLALTNTIVSSNSAASDNDVYGVYSGVANFIGGNPQLAALGDYGGTTPTIAPEFGSPVIDAGTDWVTSFLATDQRGFPRLAGAHVDIGAVEAQTAPANDRPFLGNPAYSSYTFSTFGDEFYFSTFRFSFTNSANADFTVITSTNLALPLAQWTILGNASQPVAAGQFEYSDEMEASAFTFLTNDIAFPSQKFYRVVSP